MAYIVLKKEGNEPSIPILFAGKTPWYAKMALIHEATKYLLNARSKSSIETQSSAEMEHGERQIVPRILLYGQKPYEEDTEIFGEYVDYTSMSICIYKNEKVVNKGWLYNTTTIERKDLCVFQVVNIPEYHRYNTHELKKKPLLPVIDCKDDVNEPLQSIKRKKELWDDRDHLLNELLIKSQARLFKTEFPTIVEEVKAS